MAKVTITNLDQLVSDNIDDVVTSNVNVVGAQQAVVDAETYKGIAADKASEASASAGSASLSADLAAQSVLDTRDEALRAEAAVVSAENQVTLAETKAAEALDSATLAESARVTAEQHRDTSLDVLAQVEQVYDNFDDRYLGGHSSDPVVDNDGDDIVDGALYWNTASKTIRIYNQTGRNWTNIQDANGSLLAINNLAELNSFADARANLDVLSSSEVTTEVVTEVAEQLDAQKGAINGIAELDGSGLVPASQLPSYVDDVIEVVTYADLPTTGESGKIYIVVADETSNGDTSSYRWTGSVYAIVSNTLNGADVKALYEGEADTNAFTDAEKVKLADTEITSQLDARDTANRNTDNHTDGTTNGVYTLAERVKLAAIDQEVATTSDVTFNTVNGRDVDVDGAKLDLIEDGATADQTDAEIKTAYENNADTNAFTDAEKTLVDVATTLDTTSITLPGAVNEVHDVTKYITVTQPIDLDEQLELSQIIKDKFKDTNEPTGFIREFPATMGILELCTDGTKVIHKDGYGNVTVTNNGLWSDGSSASARTFRLSPYSGNDIEVYIEGTKFRFDLPQELSLDNTTGLKFIYFDINGTLNVDSTFSFDYFEDRPIVATVYGNAVDQTLVNFGDERHGIQMDGETHRYLHFTQGTQYVSGMEIQGLTNNGITYTQITSGKAYDEDIYMEPTQQTSAPHLYRIGTDWYVQADGNDVAYMPSGIAQYNPTDGTNYSLIDVTGNDAMIVFFCLTNNIEFPYVKILGQEVYNSTNVARANIENALSALILDGLPSPEFLPIGAVIVRDGGEVQELSDGSLYYDLRNVKVAGSGGSSGIAQYHEDLLGRDVAEAHPASAIGVVPQGNLSSDSVQLALEEHQVDIDELQNITGTAIDKRYDKLLSTRDVIAMDYTSGDLDYVRYEGDDGATVYYRDVMTYTGGNLVQVGHFYGTADLVTASGQTVLTYDGNDNLVTATYTE
jgi:hypothetical protein